MSSRRPVIGVLGGMGPGASAAFYARLTAATPAERDQDHLHVLLDSDPSVPDRTDALLGRGPSPAPTLRRMAHRLEDAGADILVMACNTASAFIDDVVDAVSVPMVRWNEVVAAELAKLARSRASVAVLATDGTRKSGLYSTALARRDLVSSPTENVDAEVMAIIRARKAGTSVTELAPRLAAVVDAVRRAGADTTLLACTELSEMADCLEGSAVDAMDLVIRHLLGRVTAWERNGGAFVTDDLLAVQQA